MKRFFSALLAILLLLPFPFANAGPASDTDSFLQINDVVNRYLLTSESYDLSNPASIVKDFSDENTAYQKDRPAGYEIPATQGGTVSVSDGVHTCSEPTMGNSYLVCNLIPGIPYHYVSKAADGTVVSEGNIEASGSLRMIQVSSTARNIRDLGGWKADGGTVKYDRLFRGYAINYINENDKRLFRDWLGITAEIDLREPNETGLDGVSALGTDTEYYYVDMRYEAFQTTEINLARYNNLLNAVIGTVLLGHGTYIHCAAGADRTGQAAFLLLGLLGVSPVDIARDYELTSFSPNERLWTDPAFQTMLRQMSEFKGETFQDKCATFAQLAGVSLDRINAFRHAMIDGTPSDLKPYEPRNGFYWDNGNLYYYENDEISGNGLMVLDGYYYYVKTSDQTLAHDGEFEVAVTNGLMPQGTYQFDSQGRMIIPPPCSHLNTVVNDKKEPTCTEAGFTGDEVCKVCGKTITLGTVIPARGHSWGSWTIVTPATEFSAGLETHTCSVCHETESRTIPVLTHVHTPEPVAEIAPTCETNGSEACWKCTGCGRLFSDADGSNEIDEPIVIPAIGHAWDSGVITKAASCIEPGVMTYTCTRDAAHQRTEEILPLGHTLVKHDAKAPNETESGSIAYWECSVCGRLFGDAAGNREIKTEDTILTPVRCPSEAFTDVDRTAKSWYHEAVDWAVANHITTGTSAVTFSPNAVCTREQMVTFLWRALGEPKANRTSCPFTDVKAGDYSRNAILWAYENGIVKGTAADKFSPKAPVTREQVVTILWRLAHEPAAEGRMPFPDVKPGYAFDAIRWAAEEGVAAGYEDGTFRPTRAVTRAEIVTLLRRAFDS